MSVFAGITPVALRLFDRSAALLPAARADSRATDAAKKERRLFCALCRHPITHQDERMEVNGRHRHRCTNPGGHVFDVGCFHAAPGCAAVGAATSAHTWFAGYAWRVALCASCERHLGWRFEAPADAFHGLIVGRLSSGAGAGG